MQETKDRRLINISKITYDKVKKYCDKNTLKMNKWIEKVLLKSIEDNK